MSANQEDRISRLITSFILRGELQNYKTIVQHLFIDNNRDSERFADNNKPDKPELDVDITKIYRTCTYIEKYIYKYYK